MELEKAIKKLKRRMKELKLDYALTNFELEAIETVLQELDRLQKENEALRKLADHLENLISLKYISKDKIREKIEELEKTGCTSYDSSTADYVQSQRIGAWKVLIDLLKEE